MFYLEVMGFYKPCSVFLHKKRLKISTMALLPLLLPLKSMEELLSENVFTLFIGTVYMYCIVVCLDQCINENAGISINIILKAVIDEKDSSDR